MLCPGVNPSSTYGICQVQRPGAEGEHNLGMERESPVYCIECGAQLETEHKFCWNCGAERWRGPAAEVPEPAESERPSLAPASLGALPWFFAAGAIFFLIWVTQTAAVFAAPAGRAQLASNLAASGVNPQQRTLLLALFGALMIGAGLALAALHGAAFYGLRRQRRWGWTAAVLVAGLWSLVIVGIPVLLRLLARNTRQAFGVD